MFALRRFLPLSRQSATALLLSACLAASAQAEVSRADPGVLDGFRACSEFFFQHQAPVPLVGEQFPGKLRALCFDGFALLHSGQAKSAVYVAEHLTRASLLAARKLPRTDRFYEEARLPRAERARLADYQGSGFDRGHLAAAAQRATPEAMAQSFSLANVVPQAPEANRGAWAERVEKTTRQYALRSEQGVFVLTGPLYAQPVATVGASRVWVPSALFKLVYDPARKKAWAHVLENRDGARAGRPISLAALEKLLGTQLLPAGAVANESAEAGGRWKRGQFLPWAKSATID